MSRRWFLEARAGTGFFAWRSQTIPLPTGPQYLLGGSAGFKANSQSLLFSSDRTIRDPYGLGAASTLTTSAVWSWTSRDRAWKVFAGLSQQQTRRKTLENVDALLSTAGFGKRLTRETAATVAYIYYWTPNQLWTLPGAFSSHGVMASLVWMPGGPHR